MPNSYQTLATRIWQLDLLRGLAVIGMVIYHLLFTLTFFYGYSIPLDHWFFVLWQKTVAGTFLFLVGVSLCLSYERVREKGWSREQLFRKFVKRGLLVFACGLLVTLFTWFWIPEWYVRFGVLHLIGVSSIISLPFLSRRKLALSCAVVVLMLGPVIRWLDPHPATEALVWLNIRPWGYATIDHFPIFPWWGIILLGIGLKDKIVWPVNWPRVRFIEFMGQNALKIYLLHQPIILLLLYFVSKV